MEIGRRNILKAVRQSGPGMFLDSGDGREILLPGREIPDGLEPGATLDVFIYWDSEDRIIATTKSARIMVGQCAFLKVVGVNRVGAFLDWGLPKDLLVPFAEQAVRMEVDRSYVVTAYLDKHSQRVVASSRLGRWLKEDGAGYRVGQPVDLLIASRTDLGWKAVINQTHLGLIFHRDATRTLKPGMTTSGFIRRIRPEDQRIDLVLSPDRAKSRRSLAEDILAHLKSCGGRSDLSDHASPERILAEFGVSKGYFKKTLGSLYRERRILLKDSEVILVDRHDGEPGRDRKESSRRSEGASRAGKMQTKKKKNTGRTTDGGGVKSTDFSRGTGRKSASSGKKSPGRERRKGRSQPASRGRDRQSVTAGINRTRSS